MFRSIFSLSVNQQKRTFRNAIEARANELMKKASPRSSFVFFLNFPCR